MVGGNAQLNATDICSDRVDRFWSKHTVFADRSAAAPGPSGASLTKLLDSTDMAPRISVFPKFHFDELVSGRASFEHWIRDARRLGGEGIEHYDGFFRSLAPGDVDPKQLEELRLKVVKGDLS